MRCVALLRLTELTGGQSRRETVASQTPRTGCCAAGGVVFCGCGLAAGKGVTSDFGGSEAQPASSRAAASSSFLRAAQKETMEWLMGNSLS